MTHQPQVWHYGLVAQWWAEFNSDGPEIAYFQKCIQRFGQPTLDVGCGTGRLLLPYLRAGFDVDGCDISADMLALCREKAAAEGLSPQLYAQAMHALELPRQYKTIYVCGSFGLGGDRQQDMEGLRRVYQHLEPGGVLMFDHHLPYKHSAHWQYWLKKHRRHLPEAWPATGERRRAADGSEYELRIRHVEIDPLEQRYTLQICVGLWREGQLVREEESTLQGCDYFKPELMMMLEQVGFQDIQIQGGYTELEATAEHGIIVFIARK